MIVYLDIKTVYVRTVVSDSTDRQY